MIGWFADGLLRHRGVWMIVAIALTLGAGYLCTRVGLEVDAESLLRADDPLVEAARRYEHEFPSDENRFLVGVALDRRYDDGGEAELEAVATTLRAVPGVARVITPRSAVGGRDPAKSVALRGLLLSADGEAAAVVAFLSDEANSGAGRERVFADVQQSIERFLPAERYAIVGPPFYRREFVRLIGLDQTRFIPLSIGLLLVVLLYLFRRAWLVVLPLLSVVLTITWTGGVMGAESRSLTMLTGALPTLLICIGVAVTIHVLFQFREESNASDSKTAARRALAFIALPCLLSTITTMIGFGSLVTARVDDIREFGWLAAVGVGFSFLVAMTVVPIALSWLPRKTSAARRDAVDALLGACRRASTGHPRIVLSVTLVVLGVATFGVLRVGMDAFLTDDMGERTFIFRSYRFFERRLSSIIPVDLVIETDAPNSMLDGNGLAAIKKLETFCREQSFVDKTISVVDVLDDFRRYRPLTALAMNTGVVSLEAAIERLNEEAPVGALTGSNGRAARIVCLLQDVGASRSFAFYEDVQAFAARELEGYRVAPAGVSVVANRVVSTIIREGSWSFLMAFGVIFVVVVVLFRSLKIGALSLLGTVVPIYVGLGTMGALGIVIRTATVIVGSIALGLAIDLTIHLLSRYRREMAAGQSADDAIRIALERTGRPILVTGVILVAGFGTLATSEFGLTGEFGLLAAITIFAAILTTLLSVPALLSVLARR